MKKENIFVKGAISASLVAEEILTVQQNKKVGAHTIFIGQVRNDTIKEKKIIAIEYSAYEEMADATFFKIMEEASEKFNIEALVITHSLQNVKCGDMCLFVLVATAHRNEAYDASRFVVEAIKKQVPVFGKEIFEDESHTWKINKF